jgi:hypothetical protein
MVGNSHIASEQPELVAFDLRWLRRCRALMRRLSLDTFANLFRFRQTFTHAKLRKRLLQGFLDLQSQTKTFGECATAHIEAHKAGCRNPNSEVAWSGTLQTYARKLGPMNVADVNTYDVFEILNPIWVEHTPTATGPQARPFVGGGMLRLAKKLCPGMEITTQGAGVNVGTRRGSPRAIFLVEVGELPSNWIRSGAAMRSVLRIAPVPK